MNIVVLSLPFLFKNNIRFSPSKKDIFEVFLQRFVEIFRFDNFRALSFKMSARFVLEYAIKGIFLNVQVWE